MRQRSLAQLTACSVLLVVFVVMAVEANGFRQTAMWFPMYTAMVGAAISLVGVLAALVSLVRQEQMRQMADAAAAPTVPVMPLASSEATALLEAAADPEPGGASVEPGAPSNLSLILPGFGWLAVWGGFIVLVLLIGFIPASVLWIIGWFRTVHKWPYTRVAVSAAIVLVALVVADTQLNMGIPVRTGGWLLQIF